MAQRIRIQSFVAAARAEVRHALLRRTEEVLDALPERRWPDGSAFVEPGRLVAPWPHTLPLGSPTEVAIELQEVGDGTVVDLTHEGLGEGPGWDEAIAGYFAAWLQALAALGVLVESGIDPRPAEPLRGLERYFASGEIPSGADATWRALTDPLVLARWSDGALDGAGTLEAREGRFLRLRLAARGRAATELTLILRRTPRGTHVALAEYGVAGREPSTRWPPMFAKLARFLG
jgi:hypothetical protein